MSSMAFTLTVQTDVPLCSWRAVCSAPDEPPSTLSWRSCRCLTFDASPQRSVSPLAVSVHSSSTVSMTGPLLSLVHLPRALDVPAQASRQGIGGTQ